MAMDSPTKKRCLLKLSYSKLHAIPQPVDCQFDLRWLHQVRTLATSAIPSSSMLKQDYILRLIEQVGKAFARLMDRAKTEKPAVVHQELDDALKDLTGLSFEVLDSLPLPSILTILDSHADPDPARLLAIAECSFVRAQLADETGQANTAFRARVTSLTLYLEALALFRHEAVAGAEKRAESLLLDLESVELPQETVVRLFRFRAITGRFADAENVLFDMIERRPSDQSLIEEGRRFYQSLLDMHDAVLENGNLPRSEVIESLGELEQLSEIAPGP